MVRQLLGNIRGPRGFDGERGPAGPPGEIGEPEVYNSENMIQPEHPRSTRAGNITVIDGVETFSSTGTNTNTNIEFDHQYSLSKDKVYTISFDVVNDGVVDMDNIWIINTDGSHGNYSIHPENRYIDTNIFGVPQNERFRCFITFKPPYDLVGHLRVGSNRNEGNTGSTQISRVSLSQSYDMGYHINSTNDSLVHFGNLSGSINYSGTYSDKQRVIMSGSPNGWNSTDRQLRLDPGTYQVIAQVSLNTFAEGGIEVDIMNGSNRATSFRGNSPSSLTVSAIVDSGSPIFLSIEGAHTIREENINLRGSDSCRVTIIKL